MATFELTFTEQAEQIAHPALVSFTSGEVKPNFYGWFTHNTESRFKKFLLLVLILGTFPMRATDFMEFIQDLKEEGDLFRAFKHVHFV